MFSVRPSIKLAVLCLTTSILAAILSVAVSVRLAGRGDDSRERERSISTEQTRLATCQLVGNIVASYEEVPPITPAGKSVAEAWRDEYRILKCQPPKKAG